MNNLLITESEKNRILNMHKSRYPLNNLIYEQNTFLRNEKSILDNGYEEVTEINLPDGQYKKEGSGDTFELTDLNDKKTGYYIISVFSIRGSYGGEPVGVINKKLTEDVKKIFFKDLGYKPEPLKPSLTINENTLLNSGIPEDVMDKINYQTENLGKEVTVVGGKCVLSLEKTFYPANDDVNEIYEFDFSKTVPNLTGQFQLKIGTSDYLNNRAGVKIPGDFPAKENTQFVAFLENPLQGTLCYVNRKGTPTFKEGIIN